MTPLTITTIYNNREIRWYTVVENGIPMWKPCSEYTDHTEGSENDPSGKHSDITTKEALLSRALELLTEACAAGDDEPALWILTPEQTFHITYFENGCLYLCDELEGRYASLVPLMDNLWPLLADLEIKELRLI